MTDLYLCSVQSDCSKGRTKSLLPHFDDKGWKKVQETVINYGKAFFCKSWIGNTAKELITFYLATEECKRRIIKKEDDNPQAVDGIGEEDATTVCVEKGEDRVVKEMVGEDETETEGERNAKPAESCGGETEQDVGATEQEENGVSVMEITDGLSINVTAPNKEMNRGFPPLTHGVPTVPLALDPSTQPDSTFSTPEFDFSGEMILRGTAIQQSHSFDPLSCLATNHSGDSASQGLNTTHFMFGNQNNPNTLTFSSGALIF